MKSENTLKSNLLSIASTVFFFFVLACPSSVESNMDRRFIFVDEPISPYEVGEVGELSRGGICHDVLTHIFKPLGRTFEIRLLPWARALKTVEHGKADGLPLLMKNSERERSMVFTEYILLNRDFFYYLPERLGDFQWSSYDDLKGLTIGLVNGYAYGESFLRAAEKLKVEYAKSSKVNIRKLVAGRIDLILEDETMAGPMIASDPRWAGRVRAAEKPVSTYRWYMGLSRTSPAVRLLDDINRIIREMRRNGTLEGILEKAR